MDSTADLVQLRFPVFDKLCIACDTVKPIDHFSADKLRPDGKCPYCRECVREKSGKKKFRKSVPFVGIGVKQCGKCKEILPTSRFTVSRRRSDGLNGTCARCRSHDPEKRVAQVARQARHRETGEYQCRYCRAWLVKDEFYPNSIKGRTTTGTCRPCARRQAIEWSNAHSEQVRAKSKALWATRKDELSAAWKEWAKANTEKLRKKGRDYGKTPRGRMIQQRAANRRRFREMQVANTLTLEEWQEIVRSQEDRCLSCGKDFSSELKPTMDHVVPVSKGGGLTADNVQALCKPCNSRKGAKTIDYRT